MTTEETIVTTNGASDDAQPTQAQQPAAGNAGEPVGGAMPGQQAGFTAEQQAAVNKLLADRLKRERKTWNEELEAKAKADAEAAESQRLQEEQKWQELARKHEAKAETEAARVKELASQLERANGVVGQLLEARKAGLPESVAKLLEGRDVYDQLEIVNAFHAAQPAPAANGQQRPGAKPTPPPQGARELTPEERRQRAAQIW